MANAQRVFELAMGLMDEISEAGPDIPENKEYKNRVLYILNVLQVECFQASDTWYAAGNGRRAKIEPITNFNSDIPLDTAIAEGVLPYGLAAHLILDENPSMAAFFAARYEELLRYYAKSIPASFEDIHSCYGSIEYSQFSEW